MLFPPSISLDLTLVTFRYHLKVNDRVLDVEKLFSVTGAAFLWPLCYRSDKCPFFLSFAGLSFPLFVPDDTFNHPSTAFLVL